jgi:RNA polymerase sigma-70 factor (ECF subfamily)
MDVEVERDPLALLLRATAAGDRGAFEALYRATGAKLFGVAMMLLRRRDLAEDVLQESFLNVWRNAGQYDPGRGRAIAWLCRIVRNAAYNRFRTEPGPHEDLDDHAENLVDLVLAAPERTAIGRCLATLPPTYRRAVLLTYLYGYTNEELAQATGVPLGTVKSRVRRGAERLRRCLSE